MTDPRFNGILVTGGAGYVGSVLVPKLLAEGYKVTVLDLYLFGEDVLEEVRGNPNLTEVKGDLRDPATVSRALRGCGAVIHLACISNDPSFELDPALGKSVNYDAFRPLVHAAKGSGVKRFIYASSSSVYGVKAEADVTENLPLQPLTDYSRCKAMCEDVLAEEREPGFVTLILRPATACGYSPRLRLDLIVNILTSHAVNKGQITVFGGPQHRPNIHIDDMTDLYVRCLDYPDELIDGEVFNVGYENHTVMELAETVREVVGRKVRITVAPADDFRSYRVSSEKIRRELGFAPTHTIDQAVEGLVAALDAGKVPDAMTDPRYYNVGTLRRLGLK